MNTRFGGRQRPHFLIKRWVGLGPEEKALPAPQEQLAPVAAEKVAEAPAPEPAKKPTKNKRGVTRFDAPTVEPPTLKEELNDEIPI
jgi:hypothetical protein